LPLLLAGLCAAVLAACSEHAAQAPVMTEAQTRGLEVFNGNCAVCHVIDNSSPPTGPPLQGTIGRKAGSSYWHYSDAMKAADIIWTEDTLLAFLEKPREVVPNNGMVFFGLEDEQERADLVEFLKYLSQ
jgi:cytochrome c